MRTLIRGAAVVDGAETERYRADVLVDGTSIAAIGRPAAQADRVIDAGGLVLTP
jgi:dihydroorotase-like cyclic amidohydrolase